MDNKGNIIIKGSEEHNFKNINIVNKRYNFWQAVQKRQKSRI